MRVQLEPSYVLHARPFRETSLLLEALSRSYGRVGLVARGARGSRSRWKGLLQPFRPLLLSWNQKGELGTLTGADQVASPPALEGEALFCGLYANELITRFLQRQDPHAGLFECYQGLVSRLSAGELSQPALRMFEAELLTSAGFGLQLDHESASSNAIDESGWYLYDPETGPRRMDYRESEVKELVSGAALLALKSGEIKDQHFRELKALMRKLIRYHLGGKPLNSQALFY
ncbi:MAG: DNA repair protein RecO [Xanthomonadales bacterium]|jgi:DNA repair protein RecO (recombination protein O)|nr:DNA repair protein RecO [Xanthomonadales bacterium]